MSQNRRKFLSTAFLTAGTLGLGGKVLASNSVNQYDINLPKSIEDLAPMKEGVVPITVEERKQRIAKAQSIMEKEKMNVLGLVGLILGIIAALLSFVPCVGMWAVVPGFIGIIMSAIGLKHVKKGMAIAGLICSLVGTSIGVWQWYTLNQLSKELNEEMIKMD